MTTRRSFFSTALAFPVLAQTGRSEAFRWPQGKRAAISLTFDDARLSQIDTGLDLLRRHNVKATFYLSPDRVKARLDGWKKAVGEGHEIGNHSATHPCTGNYRFSRSNALEDFTEAEMAADLDRANEQIRRLLGVTPVSFAYPCGQKFVGRGESTRSYVPLVAKRFLTGRGYLDESANDPAICDLAQLMGTGFDDAGFPEMERHVAAAVKESRWIIFVGHEIGSTGYQTTRTAALDELCRYAKDPANGLWLDTVGAVGRHVQRVRSAGERS